jgi:N6-L-threonylcarbamoyladenine synthase
LAPVPKTRQNNFNMNILGIESSCDETAAAVVSDGHIIHSSIVASQINLHESTGGIVPEVAARAHLQAIVPVIEQAMLAAACDWHDIDAIGATNGPGLPGALLIGFNAARGLAYSRNIPLIPVDHIEGHIRACWLNESPPPLPALALVVSGGHTELIRIEENNTFVRLGSTRDDAAGEAFDKVARLLGLPYPGGPPLSALAETAAKRELRLPRAWLRGTNDFSFSGLKTAVLNLLKEKDHPDSAEIAWAFQESVCDVLAKKTRNLAEKENVKSVLVAGGVAANRRLREVLSEHISIELRIPPPNLCTDNGAMIAAAAYAHKHNAVNAKNPLDIEPTAMRKKRLRKIDAD